MCVCCVVVVSGKNGVLKKPVKKAVPEDGNPPGALVLMKLVEWYRFEVGQKNEFL